jgi:uncharacterized protein YegP (UPF0339 family)
MNSCFEIYPSKGQWRWQLVSANSKIIATAGEAYHNYADCERSVDIVRIAGRDNWSSYEQPNGPYAKAFYLYTDTASEYRWRLYAENGRAVAAASEGYATRSGARDAVLLTKTAWCWPLYKRAA